MAEGSEDQKRIIEEKDKLIKRQFIRIEELESELTALKEERDALLCDVNKLRFELEMSELKRLKDVRTPTFSQQSSISGEPPPPTPDTEDNPKVMDGNDIFARKQRTMSRTKCDSTISSSPWCQDDYRNSSKFRGKQIPTLYTVTCEDKWDGQGLDQVSQKLGTSQTESKLNKYSLVIVLPSVTGTNDKSSPSDMSIAQSNIVMDSGVGSMSPSPPKTPTPDYDSLEDSYESVKKAGTCNNQSPISSTGMPITKKVHFSIADGTEPPSQSNKSFTKSSWRDLLVCHPLDYQEDLNYCYRQDWVNGETKCKSKSKRMYKNQHLSTTILHDLEQFSERSSRTDMKRRNGTKLVRRASSLDRFAELRYSHKYHDRSPSLCDPDPLKEPVSNGKRKFNKKSSRIPKTSESSSLKPVERASCGPGPPLKQLRSYSVESNGNCNFASSQLGRARQRSVSGNVASKKTPVRRVDDDALKRSRLHNSQYELSQDLLDKQVEMLERKYGGVCARKAALTIQRAFRKYTIMKRFQDIANASKGEKRLSRRFPTFDVENKEWVVYNTNGTVSRYPHFQHHQACYEGEVKLCNNFHAGINSDAILQSHYNALYRELNDTLDSDDSLHYSKPCRTQSFRERRIKFQEAYGQGLHVKDSNNKESYEQYVGKPVSHLNSAYYQDAYQSPAMRSPPSFPRHPAWTAVPNANTQRTHCSPNQSNVFVNSGPSIKIQHQPTRDSISSEDSSLSSLSVDIDSSEGDSNIHRGSSVRNSLNISPSKMPTSNVLQRNSIRASDVALSRRVSPRVDQKKVPPQVPKRTSSIPSRDDSSDSVDIIISESSQMTLNCNSTSSKTVEASPVWKRKSLVLAEQSVSVDDKRLSNISENSEDSIDSGGGYSNTAPADMSHSFNAHNYPDVRTPHDLPGTPTIYKLTEIQRKRQYRVGLNLFNKKPERGIRYLIQRGFLEASPQAVARFLLTRKGLSKQMIGEYLGNLQNSFNMAVLECFVQELDLAGMQVDVALRKFQTFFRMPGEAQKIERLVEVFSHRYIDCNHDIASKFHNPETVFVLAFAIIMLNTDLHTPNMKAERRMKIEEFVRNLRSIDDGHDLDRDMLIGIYERIKTNEFKMGSDHVTQVLKVQQTIVGKKPNLALPHRRLVCYCRLYEVYDVSKKERPGVHQREVFLFNDLLMVTKIFSKKKNGVTYTFRQSFPLCGMSVTLFEAPYYPHGIRLSQRVDDKVLITFNARNEHDRSKFVEDLKESILEMDEMENLRIEGELEKQKMMRVRGAENRDSGVADMEIIPQPTKDGKLSPESVASANLKRSALSNSLLDLHEQQVNKPVRRGSAGSLDSGMSISFQSSAASSVSHDSSPQIVHASSTSSGSGSSLGSTRSGQESASAGQKQPPTQAGFLGGLFSKKGKHTSKSNMRKTIDGSDT